MLEIAYLCTVIAVTDGDTFKVRCPIWPDVVTEAPLRVRGIDTPEKGHRAKCENERIAATSATAYAKTRLEGKTVVVKSLDKDKYGRLLADVVIDGESWADAMVRQKHAIPYDGGTKTNPWCR